jgi:hypothetical protein
MEETDKHNSTQQSFSSPKHGRFQQLEQQIKFVQITCGAIKCKAWESVTSPAKGTHELMCMMEQEWVPLKELNFIRN